VEHANFIDSATARLVAERDAFVVPTLVCYEVTAQHGEKLGLTPYVMEKLDGVNKAGIAMLDICRSAGARMGFGTDLMGEMEYAQSYEFTIRGRAERPVDILRSATSVNAQILQQTGSSARSVRAPWPTSSSATATRCATSRCSPTRRRTCA
jgi:imidazolonepropionase-like amidohydrolase